MRHDEIWAYKLSQTLQKVTKGHIMGKTGHIETKKPEQTILINQLLSADSYPLVVGKDSKEYN